MAVLIKGKLGISNDVFVEMVMVYLVIVLRMLPLATSMTANFTRMRTLSDSIDRIFSTVGFGESEIEMNEIAYQKRHPNDFKNLLKKCQFFIQR